MRATMLVARIELRRRFRNRSALFSAFVGPLLLAVVFGILLGGTSSLSLKIGIVDLDRSDITSTFAAGLVDREGQAADSPVTFVAIDSQTEAGTAVDDGDLDAAIVMPAGFSDAVTSGRSATITILRDPRNEISAGVAASVAGQFAAGISSRSLAVATVAALGGSTPTSQQLGSMTDTVLTAVHDEVPGGREVDASGFYGVSMSILFLFFTVAFAARSLIAERKTGLIPRMLAASTSAGSIVAGKVLAVCVLGLLGFLTVWAVTAVAFGSNWGDPIAVVLAMSATVLAVGGAAVFVCGLARTEEQADGYTSAVAFALALLGGNFVGPGQAPEALQRAAAFTPNGQAIDAFTRIAADQVGVAGIARQLLILVAIAACFGMLGLGLIGRRVRR